MPLAEVVRRTGGRVSYDPLHAGCPVVFEGRVVDAPAANGASRTLLAESGGLVVPVELPAGADASPAGLAEGAVVRDGGEAVAPEIARMVAETPRPLELTDRQREILSAVARGFTTPDIARILGISQSAVKQHLAHVCEKLGASNRSEAAAIAVRRHLVKG